MRYLGDGSYKPEDYQLEASLSDLIKLEHEAISKLNSAITAYDKAKKTGLQTFQYIKDIEKARENTDKCRERLKEYFTTQLDVTINDLLAFNKELKAD